MDEFTEKQIEKIAASLETTDPHVSFILQTLLAATQDDPLVLRALGAVAFKFATERHKQIDKGITALTEQANAILRGIE